VPSGTMSDETAMPLSVQIWLPSTTASRRNRATLVTVRNNQVPDQKGNGDPGPGWADTFSIGDALRQGRRTDGADRNPERRPELLRRVRSRSPACQAMLPIWMTGPWLVPHWRAAASARVLSRVHVDPVAGHHQRILTAGGCGGPRGEHGVQRGVGTGCGVNMSSGEELGSHAYAGKQCRMCESTA
jgi:hypothetical protein